MLPNATNALLQFDDCEISLSMDAMFAVASDWLETMDFHGRSFLVFTGE
jgi:hypothetical protein